MSSEIPGPSSSRGQMSRQRNIFMTRSQCLIDPLKQSDLYLCHDMKTQKLMMIIILTDEMIGAHAAECVCMKEWRTPQASCSRPSVTELPESVIYSTVSRVMRKPILEFSGQVRHKPGCTTTEDG